MQLDCVKELIASGADKNVRNLRGFTPSDICFEIGWKIELKFSLPIESMLSKSAKEKDGNHHSPHVLGAQDC